MRVNLCYVSAACNPTTNILDWGTNGLICYGSSHSVIIYNPKYPGTAQDVTTLIGHKEKVNAVQWIHNNDQNETELVSVSNDKTAIIWSLIENEYKSVVLEGHENGINFVHTLYTGNDKNELLIATASADSTVRLWKRKQYGKEATVVQVLNFGHGLCLALKLAYLPNSSNILLACARDNSKIELYNQFFEDNSFQFKLICSLKGHENWVRGLDFTTDDNGNLFLASSSQDTFIRIWCIKPSVENSEKKSALDLIKSHTLHAMETEFSIISDNKVQYFKVHLESVLSGHEGWVYQVHWAPTIRNEDGTNSQPMRLLSASLDKTMLIWALDKSSGLWVETVRVGEIGGNTLGFYGCKFSPDGHSILAHGYLGSLHMWNYSDKLDTWLPAVTPSGHSNEVIDIAWEPNGRYVMSVSADQTTRIHAPCMLNDNKVSWHELARPQVHGYDMSCLAILSCYKFISGAEEKILRAFQAPSNFVNNFRRLCKISGDLEGDEIISTSTNGPRGASVPSLGLSNKAVYDSNNEIQKKGTDPYPEDSYFHEITLQGKLEAKSTLKAPPTEENLLQNTLWPETQKLYGHGYEVYALAASSDGQLVASACKATTIEHAAIILWDTSTWNQKQKLISHTLTVTQIMFAPDNQRLLSVSRDRRWTIFERNESDEFMLTATTDKRTGVHTRIVWCCAWSRDSKYFITGSRDGKAVVWWKNVNLPQRDSVLGFYESMSVLELKGESITAIAFASVIIDNSYLLCLGLESGVMMIYKWSPDQKWDQCYCFSQSLAHHLTVKRIFFRPGRGRAGITEMDEDDNNILQIASCSLDHSVKIYNVFLNEKVK